MAHFDRIRDPVNDSGRVFRMSNTENERAALEERCDLVLGADTPLILTALTMAGGDGKPGDWRGFVVEKSVLTPTLIEALRAACVITHETPDGERVVFAAHRHTAADLFDAMFRFPRADLARMMREALPAELLRIFIRLRAVARFGQATTERLRAGASRAPHFQALLSAPTLTDGE